jgi:LacI family transcriptional regulator
LKYIGPSRTLNGITDTAGELGYALLLEELPRFDTENIKPLLQNLLARHVDGIAWAVPQVGENRCWVGEILSDLPVPVIFLTMPAQSGVPTVSMDNYSGGVMAVEHLLNAGRVHIGHISGPLDWWEARERKQAWQDCLARVGFSVPEGGWVEGNWSSSSGETAFDHLLHSYPQMDAVFVGNDQMALAAQRSAHHHGLRIPEDLAMVGFDNLPESAYFWPALTTIDQNLHEMGCQVVHELVDRIEAARGNQEIAAQSILLTPELVIRESSVLR